MVAKDSTPKWLMYSLEKMRYPISSESSILPLDFNFLYFKNFSMADFNHLRFLISFLFIYFISAILPGRAAQQIGDLVRCIA